MGGGIPEATKNLNPLTQISDAKDRAEGAVTSAVGSVEGAVTSAAGSVADAIAPAAKTTPPVPVSSPENATGPASKAPEPEAAPAWTHGDLSGAVLTNQPSDFGMDSEFMAKMQRTKDLSKKIGALQAMSPVARAEALQGSGLSQDNVNKIQQELGGALKQQQQTEQQAGEKAGETATKEEKEAGELEPVAKTLSTIGGYGVVAAAGITAAPAVTTGVVAAEIAKASMLFKMADLTTDGAEAVVSKVFPNAGWKTKAAVSLVGGLAGFAIGGKALNQVPFLRTAAEMPEVKAAMEDTQHTMSDPVGLKHVEPEVMEGPATASESAKKVGPALTEKESSDWTGNADLAKAAATGKIKPGVPYNGSTLSEEEIAKYKDLHTKVASAASSGEISNEGNPLYRGEKYDTDAQVLDRFKPGAIITHKEITSAAFDKEVANEYATHEANEKPVGIVLNYTSKNGAHKGVEIGEGTGEYALPEGGSYKVSGPPVKDKDGVWNVNLEAEAKPTISKDAEQEESVASLNTAKNMGLRVAVRDISTDKVYPGALGETHADPIERVEKEQGRVGDFEAGYVDSKGKYYTREEASAAIGRPYSEDTEPDNSRVPLRGEELYAEKASTETAAPQTLEEKAAAGIQKAGLPVKLVSAEARANRLLKLRNTAEAQEPAAEGKDTQALNFFTGKEWDKASVESAKNQGIDIGVDEVDRTEGAGSINTALRGGKDLAPVQQRVVDAVDDHINSTKPLKEDTVFYRGIAASEHAPTGSPEKGYTFLTKNEEEAKSYADPDNSKATFGEEIIPPQKITVLAGSRVGNLTAHTNGEDEWVLPRGSTIKKTGDNEYTVDNTDIAPIAKGDILEKRPAVEEGKNNPAVSKLTSTVANASPDESQIKEPMKQGGDSIVQAAKDSRVYALGQTAKDIGIEENEPVVNKAINRNPSTPLTDGEKTDYQGAKDTSITNIAKLSAEHIKAAAADDGNRVSLIGDLFTHESAKLNHLDKALGLGGNVDVATQTAKTAVQSSDLLTTIGSQQGTPATRLAKTAKIMDWHHYMDPANVAVSAALFNPHLWLAKAATDLAWLPYNNIVKGLAHVASFHPQDAFTIWGAAMKGARDAVGDATIYGAKSYATGERVAEKELGMLKAPENTSTVFGEDYETNPGQAIQGTASAFNPANMAKLKNLAGMTLNAGPRVILAEDQFAKTFAQRAAIRTAATVKGLQDADAQGIGFMDRATFAKAQAEKYINDQPEWLTKAANNETYQLTFTSDNNAAKAVQDVLSKGVIPATAYTPEFHWGRLLGGLFVKTPFNLMKQAFINSPMALAMKESAGWTGDFESKRLAATKMAVGSSIMSGIFLAAGSHLITGDGPVDPNQARMRKEMGIPDRSIGAFGHYVSYEGLGPLSNMIALGANAAESYHAATPENKGAYVAHVATAFARLVDHLPLMHQVGYLEQAIQSAGRGDFKDMEGRLADSMSTGIRPEILKQISESLDPTIKQSNTAIQRLAQDNPYTRAGVPLKRDHWGYPQYVPPGYEHDEVPPSPLEAALYLFNPFHLSTINKPDPVDVERMRVGANDRNVPEMFIGGAGPQGITSDANSPKVGVAYHPTDVVEAARLHDRLSVLAGHELTIGGVNQHDAMQNEMNKDYYKGHTEYWQADKLDKISLQYLEHARIQLMKENPDLRDRVRDRQGQRREEMSGGHATIGAP
jgi:hypothetical protein